MSMWCSTVVVLLKTTMYWLICQLLKIHIYITLYHTIIKQAKIQTKISQLSTLKASLCQKMMCTKPIKLICKLIVSIQKYKDFKSITCANLARHIFFVFSFHQVSIMVESKSKKKNPPKHKCKKYMTSARIVSFIIKSRYMHPTNA